MTVTPTYMSDLSRVRVAFTGAPAIADYAKVERSTDGINWTTVRGGDVVDPAVGFLDDFEFVAGVANTYRVSFVDNGPITSVPAAGAAVTGNNASLTPPLPAGWAEGDALLMLVSIRTATANPVQPTGWTQVLSLTNFIVFGKRAAATETAPTVNFSGGAAGADTIAQITAFKNLDILPVTYNLGWQDAAAQNLVLPSLSVPQQKMMNLWLAWKQSSWTSVTDPGGFAVIGSTSSTAGSGSGQWWSYTVQGATDIDFTPRTLTVAGGVSAIGSRIALSFRPAPWITQQTGSITPALASAWLKNPSRPSLNTAVTVTNIGDVSRKARSGTFDVIGRTMPVVVSDVMGSRQLSITLMVSSIAAANELDGRLAAGTPVFLQAPTASAVVPTLYATVTGYSTRKSSQRGVRRFFDLDLVEVAAPASTVYGNTYVYADVVTEFATYNSVLAGVSTYFQLMDRVSTSSVIVP